MVLALVLLDRKLQLADCLLYLNLEDHILSLWLGKAIVHLDNFIVLSLAHFFNSQHCLFDMVD